MANAQQNLILRLIGESQGMSELNKQAQMAEINMGKLAHRAAFIIPMWAALRMATLALPRAIAATTAEWMSFQEEMARVATATRSSAEGLQILEKSIISVARTSKASFKDAASAVYALGSAGLTASQQLVGFESVLDVAIGTAGDLELTSKLVAGAFNVFSKKMKDAGSDAEKFKRIADTIAYTFSVQQVELDEIATAMGYVASVGSLVDISFEELTATIGVLNTGMLKGSKAGTSLLNAFIQLANKSDKLLDLDISVDSSKPLNFLEVMTKLHDRYKGSEMTLSNIQKIMSTFGIRGGRAVALLINNWDNYTRSIEQSGEKSKDFAKIMRYIQEDNIPAVITKISNSFKSIGFALGDSIKDPVRKALDYIEERLQRFHTNEAVRAIRGQTTKVEAFSRAMPRYGTAGAALFAASRFKGALGIQDTFAQAELLRDNALQARKLVMESGPKSIKHRIGLKTDYPELYRSAEAVGTKKAYGKDALTSSMFMAQARKDIYNSLNPLQKLGTNVAMIGKTALLAVAGLQMVQGLLNQFYPDSVATKLVNQGMDAAAKGIATGVKAVVENGYYFSKAMYNIATDTESETGRFVLATKTFLTTLGSWTAAVAKPVQGVIDKGSGVVKQTVARGVINAVGLGKFGDVSDLLEKAAVAFYDKVTDAGVDFAEYSREMLKIKKEEEDRLKADTILGNMLDSGLSDLGKQLALITEDAKGGSIIEDARAKLDAAEAKKEADALGFQPFIEDLEELNNQLGKGEISINTFVDRAKEIYDALNQYTKVANLGPILLKTRAVAVSSDPDQTNKDVLAAATNIRKKFGFDAYDLLMASEGGEEAFAQGARTKAITEMSESPYLPSKLDIKELNMALDKVYNDIEAKSMTLFGFSEDVIAFKQLNDSLDLFKTNYAPVLRDKQVELTIDNLLVMNRERIIELTKGDAEAQKDLVALHQQVYELMLKQQEVIKSTGAFVRDAYKDVFTNLFEGNDFNEISDKFSESLGDGIKSNLASTFGDALSDITGTDAVFGATLKGIFDTKNELTNPIAKAHLDAMTKGAEIIKQAHIQGMTTGARGTSKTYGDEGGVGGAIQEALSKPMFLPKASGAALTSAQALNVLRASKKPITSNTDYLWDSILDETSDLNYGVMPKSNYAISNLGAELQKNSGVRELFNQFTGEKNASWGGLLRSSTSWAAGGIGLGAATGTGTKSGLSMLSLLSGGRNLGSAFAAGAGSFYGPGRASLGRTLGAGFSNLGSFKGSGIGGAIGGTVGLMNTIDSFKKGNTVGGVGGILQTVGGYASMLPGWGGVAGMALQLVGTVMSLFSGGDKKTDVQTKTDTFKVASKIDITNQRLDIINRNLLAIKDTMTYMLPESAYFSESLNISDQFSIHARRGLA